MNPIIKRVHELDDKINVACRKFSIEVAKQMQANLVGLLEEGDVFREKNTTKLVTRVVKYRGDGQIDLVAFITEQVKTGEVEYFPDVHPARRINTVVAVDILRELES